MSAKDILKLLLLSYGFNKKLSITTYRADGGFIGYDITASNGDLEYTAKNCEGLMFHIYLIEEFMNKNNVKPKLTYKRYCYTIKGLLKMSQEEFEEISTI